MKQLKLTNKETDKILKIIQPPKLTRLYTSGLENEKLKSLYRLCDKRLFQSKRAKDFVYWTERKREIEKRFSENFVAYNHLKDSPNRTHFIVIESSGFILHKKTGLAWAKDPKGFWQSSPEAIKTRLRFVLNSPDADYFAKRFSRTMMNKLLLNLKRKTKTKNQNEKPK